MNPVTAQRHEATALRVGDCVGLECESQLRIAAAMLARALPGEISATTVVGDLRADDERQFESMVAEIGDEYGLDATLRIEDGKFSVRFTVPFEAEEDGRAGDSGGVSWLTRLLPGWRQAA
jgi:hypothetical protein